MQLIEKILEGLKKDSSDEHGSEGTVVQAIEKSLLLNLFQTELLRLYTFQFEHYLSQLCLVHNLHLLLIAISSWKEKFTESESPAQGVTRQRLRSRRNSDAESLLQPQKLKIQIQDEDNKKQNFLGRLPKTSKDKISSTMPAKQISEGQASTAVDYSTERQIIKAIEGRFVLQSNKAIGRKDMFFESYIKAAPQKHSQQTPTADNCQIKPSTSCSDQASNQLASSKHADGKGQMRRRLAIERKIVQVVKTKRVKRRKSTRKCEFDPKRDGYCLRHSGKCRVGSGEKRLSSKIMYQIKGNFLDSLSVASARVRSHSQDTKDQTSDSQPWAEIPDMQPKTPPPRSKMSFDEYSESQFIQPNYEHWIEDIVAVGSPLRRDRSKSPVPPRYRTRKSMDMVDELPLLN